jgi:Uncharacterized protein conserved in bacteria
MADEPALLRVSVCYALPGRAWMRELTLAPGATVADALAASGFGQAFPDVDVAASGVGVYGKRCDPARKLEDGDRVEVYRPLVFDPMESRRRRAAKRK